MKSSQDHVILTDKTTPETSRNITHVVRTVQAEMAICIFLLDIDVRLELLLECRTLGRQHGRD